MNRQIITSKLSAIGRIGPLITINGSKVECRMYVPQGDKAINDRQLSQLECVKDMRTVLRQHFGDLIVGDKIVARLYYGVSVAATVVFQLRYTEE